MALFLNKKNNKVKFHTAVLMSSLALVFFNETCLANHIENNSTKLTENDFNLEFELKDDLKLEVTESDICFILKIFDIDGNKVNEKYLDRDSDFILNQIIVDDGVGFALITENIIDDGAENKFKAMFFDVNIELLLTKTLNEIKKDEILNTIKETCILEDFSDNNYNTLSQVEILKKALELLEEAQKTLSEFDIKKVQEIAYLIEDDENRNDILEKLNLISKESIEKELNLNNALPEVVQNTINASEITISANSNQIIFNDLKVGVDTIIPKAFTLNVISLLPYNINLKIQEDIVSSSSSILDKSFFQAKLSTDSEFMSFAENNCIQLAENQSAGANSYDVDLKMSTSTTPIKEAYKATFEIEAITK